MELPAVTAMKAGYRDPLDGPSLEERGRALVNRGASLSRDLHATVSDLRATVRELRITSDITAARESESHNLTEDLADLANKTTGPFLFVDAGLCITRIVPAAEHPFNISSASLGRPIAEIRSRLGNVDLESVARRVIETSAPEQVILRHNDTPWRVLRVLPLRSANGHTRGAMLTLLVADPLHGQKLTQSVIESIPMPVLVVSSQMLVSFVSREFLTFYGLGSREVETRCVAEIAKAPFILPEFREALARLGSGETDLEEFESVNGDRTVLVRTQRIIRDEIDQVLITVRDGMSEIDRGRAMAQALQQTREALRASREEHRVLTRRLLDAQDEERRRISRDLHDGLSQSVAALAFQVEELANNLSPLSGPETQSLTALRSQVASLADGVRTMAHTLHPATLDVLGLTAALHISVSEFSQRTGIQARFGASGVPTEIPIAVVESYYRIAQEALRNVARHAACSSVSVSLLGADSVLTLSIRDNGPGFDREAVRGHGGLGLVSMQERARLVRARFELATAPGAGVAITVTVPLPKMSAAKTTA